MIWSVAIMTSCLGELSAGSLYHCVTVGQWFFYDWLKISSAENISIQDFVFGERYGRW